VITMELKKINPIFEDQRGKIIDILVDQPVEHVNLITFKKGAIRANHYHEQTLHYNYVLSGTLKLYTQSKKGEKVVIQTLTTGELVLIPSGERHALEAVEDASLLVFSRGPRGGVNYENDTYRLKPDELLTRKEQI
jgi:quercetin dioxygenase-like cupin family protein